MHVQGCCRYEVVTARLPRALKFSIDQKYTKKGIYKVKASGKKYKVYKYRYTYKEVNTLSKGTSSYKYYVTKYEKKYTICVRAVSNKGKKSSWVGKTLYFPIPKSQWTRAQKTAYFDSITDEDGTLEITLKDLEDFGYKKHSSGSSKIPSDFTKATRVILPTWMDNGKETQRFSEYDPQNVGGPFKGNVVYVVTNKFSFIASNHDETNVITSNYLNITQKDDYFCQPNDIKWDTEKALLFPGLAGGVTTITMPNKLTGEIDKFNFEITRVAETEDFKRFTKVKEALAGKSDTTDLEKFEIAKKLKREERERDRENGITWDCGTHSTIFSIYCNMLGIPCQWRRCGQDHFYSQSPNHQNVLMYLDGELIVYDPQVGNSYKYSQDYDNTGHIKSGVTNMFYKDGDGNLIDLGGRWDQNLAFEGKDGKMYRRNVTEPYIALLRLGGVFVDENQLPNQYSN